MRGILGSCNGMEVLSVLADVIDVLACPVCAAALVLADGVVSCGNGHAFDVAREGYVNLLGGRASRGTADTPAMVDARARFLAAGHYAPIAAATASALAVALPSEVAGCLVDVGAGTGYHLAAALDALPDRVGLALDISKSAARRGARAHERIGAAVCDTWSALPVRCGTAAAVLDIFAPRNAPEMSRVLAPGGVLLVVTPTARHLRELVSALDLISVDERKDERLEQTLGTLFERSDSAECEYRMSLERSDIEAIVAMGPSARHDTGADRADRIRRIEGPVTVTASVKVATYRRMSTQ